MNRFLFLLKMVHMINILNFIFTFCFWEEIQVLELNAGHTVREAIHMLFEKNVCGAPIADALDPDATVARFSDRYIGFINFASILLWSLHKCEITHDKIKEKGGGSFFTMLDQNPQIGHTKVLLITFLLVYLCSNKIYNGLLQWFTLF